MSQKLIILFAVIATFIACASSSSEVQTNLQAKGKQYVYFSFFNVTNLRQRKTNYMNQIILYDLNWFCKKNFIFSENASSNETTSDLPKPHSVITGASDTLEENQELKVQVNYKKGIVNDNITEIFEILKEHGNDITNLRIQQGYTSGKLKLGHIIP